MEYLGLGFGTVKPEEPHRKTRFGSVRFYNRNFASSICVGRLRFGVWDLVDDPSSICVGHGSLPAVSAVQFHSFTVSFLIRFPNFSQPNLKALQVVEQIPEPENKQSDNHRLIKSVS
ncbi:hypothetical protein ABKV19_011549 [Rosa sericea]